MPVISTMKKRTSSSSSGPLETKLQKQSEVLHLKNALKSHFPKGVTEMDFVGSAEEVGEKHTTFLCSWLAVSKGTSKEVERKAMQDSAGQKMASSSVNACVDKLREVRKMVQRKGRNMKTGALMAPWCKELLAVVVGLPADGTKQSAPVGKAQAKQSGKIVPVKASLEKADCSSEDKIVPVKAGLEKADGSSEEIEVPMTQESVMTVESSEICSPAPSSGPLALPEEAPAVLKKPAAVLKKPAKKSAKSKTEDAWKVSQSFGYVKLGCFKEKSYILSKKEEAGKPSLLVNVQGKGVDHKAVALQLFEFVRGPGLGKAQVVAHKNSLL